MKIKNLRSCRRDADGSFLHVSTDRSTDFHFPREEMRQVIRALYSVLIKPSTSLQVSSSYEQWAAFFSIATDYERQKPNWAINPSVQKSFHALGLEIEKSDFGRGLFAAHTCFAIISKLLGLEALWAYCEASLVPALKAWPLLDKNTFAANFRQLESGAHFGAAGLENFLQDDLFAWYTCVWNQELEAALRSLISRFASHPLSSGIRTTPSGDILKGIYMRLVPSPLRKALGEFYTPDWLAERALQVAEFTGNPETRLLDPACGSGTFLLLAIRKVLSDARSDLIPPAILLRKICHNIAGIDLNPLAVIAARANYLITLGPLLQHRGSEPLDIPVYLGDSIRMPSDQKPATGSAPSGNGPTTAPRGKHSPGPINLSVPFDCIVGNPPWIGWENLPEHYRRATKNLWHEHGLFVHRGMDTILGKGKKDLSMLMTYVAAEHYLRPAGRLAFIITQAVFKMAGAGQGFRRFRTRSDQFLHCQRVEDYSALQLFDGASTLAALFVINKGEQQKYPTPYFVFRTKQAKTQRIGPTDRDYLTTTDPINLTCEEHQAEPADPRDLTSPWLTASGSVFQAIKKVLGPSAYQGRQGVNTGGANAVYWFEIIDDATPDTVLARNILGAAKRRINSEPVRLEKSRLYPLLRGPDVAPWRAQPRAWLLCVQDPHTRRGLSESDMAKTPHALHWLERNKKLLLERAAYKRFFKHNPAPFWSMFDVGDYTFKPWKVVWPRIARRIEAAVVSTLNGKIVLAQETFSFIGVDGESEAFFLAGVLNCTPFRFTIRSFSQPGSKSFGTPGILQRAHIPRFEPASSLHQDISTEARRISSSAADSVRPFHADLDVLCGQLWALTPNELCKLQEASM